MRGLPEDWLTERRSSRMCTARWEIGRWEGDTLVVDVTNFTDESWLGADGWFHSDAMRVVRAPAPRRGHSGVFGDCRGPGRADRPLGADASNAQDPDRPKRGADAIAALSRKKRTEHGDRRSPLNRVCWSHLDLALLARPCGHRHCYRGSHRHQTQRNCSRRSHQHDGRRTARSSGHRHHLRVSRVPGAVGRLTHLACA